MPVLTLTCDMLGGGQVYFRHDTNNNNQPLSLSFDGVNWQAYDPNNPPPNDNQCRVALFHAAVDFWYSALPANQRNCNISAAFAVHLSSLLLGDLIPGGPQCQHCNNPDGTCESYKFYPGHLTRMLCYLQNGSGRNGNLWSFPNQAPVVRKLVYGMHRHAAPGSPFAAPNHWNIHNNCPVGPTCVVDGIRRLCDYNIIWNQLGTMPRPV